MIAVNLKEGEEIVKLLLSKGADVNEKSLYAQPSNESLLTCT